MFTYRDSMARGVSRTGWLESRHSFSFGDYRDPRHMGFRSLRVINEDRVVPGAGFPTHGHKDMDIVSIVLEGTLEHRDSLGNGAQIRPGEVQRMSAGTGILHGEFNPSATEPVHFLQIWIVPGRKGLPPSYEQRQFPNAQRRGQLLLVAAPQGEQGALTLHQDARLYVGALSAGETVTHSTQPGRGLWLQVVRGTVALNGTALHEGDGAAAEDESAITLEADTDTEVLLFDLR